MSERPTTCLATPCVVCGDHAHRLGELCPNDAHCPVRAINLGMTCRRCHDRMASQLREIPELYALALGELETGSGNGGRSSETSLGLRLAALDLRHGGDVIGVLVSWELDWRETYDDDTVTPLVRADDRAGATIVEVCGYLLAGLHRACTSHPAIDVFAQELAEIHGAARTAARTTGARHTEVECPADHDDGICGARIRVSGLELTDVVYCPRCRSRWELHRLLLVAASDTEAGVWLPVDDVALLLGVSRRTLFRWAKAGHVQREHGLFELESVRTAIHDDAARRA